MVGDDTGGSNHSEVNYSCGVELIDEDWEIINQYRWWISGVLSSLFSLLGLVGNSISLIVICKRSMANLFNQLLSCLCIADILFLISNLLVLPFHFGLDNRFFSFVFPFFESSCHFSLSASIFLIMNITVERWQAVCYPHYYQERTSNKSLRLLTFIHVFPVIVLSLLFNITKFISIFPLGLTLQKIPEYVKFLLFFQAFHPLTTTGLVPLLILSVMNYKIYSQMSEAKKFFRPESKRTKDFMLAKIMMALVMVFLILNTPRIILGVYEVTQLKIVEKCFKNNLEYHMPKLTYILDFVARFLVILNSSINFLIYCMVGSEFRSNLFAMMGIRTTSTRPTATSMASLLKEESKITERKCLDGINEEAF